MSARLEGKKSVGSRVLAGMRIVRDVFPLTWLGVAVLGAAVASLKWLAFGEMDLVALVLGWGAVGLVGVSLVIVVVVALVVRLRGVVLDGRAVRMSTDAEMPTGFSVARLAWVPLLTVDVRVVAPASLDRRLRDVDGRLEERLVATARGAHEELTRRFEYGDVFGLTRIAFWRVERRSVFVTPHLGKLSQMPTLRSLASGDDMAHPAGTPDGDRIDLRRYAPGDPARFIHWKVFARTRKLVVRVPERALAPSHRVVAYLVAGDGDEPTAAAALAAVRYGALGEDWLFGADGSPNPTGDVDAAVTAIVRSAAHAHEGGRDLEAFVRAAEREGPASIVLFVPPSAGEALDRALAVLRPRGAPVQVVSAIDMLEDAAHRTRLQRLVMSAGALRGTPRAALDRLRARVEALGANVIVVERPTGRVLATHGRVATELSERAA